MTEQRDLSFLSSSSVPRRRDALRLLSAAALGAGAWPAFAQDSKRLPRLVTVSGAITEVVYALGAEGQLVGTDTTSLFPAAARATPKVGYMRQLSAEGLLSLKPDAIIATNESGPTVVLDQIRTAGVKVEIIEADHSWVEVQRKVQAVGRAAAKEVQARELQARLDAEWAQVLQRIGGAKGRKPKVLFVLSHSASPQVSGEKTAAHAVIGFAGGVNALGGFNGYRPMTAEAMASAAPDIILTSTQSIEAHGGVERFWQRSELALTPAYKKRALITQDALLLLGFGPRLPAAIGELHDKFRAALA
ncbi:iron complex transport system substrate-binding protein [Variovorax boronicumulans]|uniref:Iron complex transport system substrate-binding protein n=1 Tax=Variovorax boronicumulans TaxID=436515 RepID=A0AAW8E6B0_9BURK|nr:ABC transporter substrate-binding protein [Variovorax boronicumulans]MDP9882121.1 iron complex transport system substrate-binding protein [Variovorax boronicumulans]MDP9927408.1 iron complex transport system substrate-binding protein [Variovorax boronicumulans]